ncbi:MAG TPA: DUF3332 family protein [Planctomycetota bacterium]|nr:DUF3332 family protein [Planctomycetota bacterium]
MTTGTRMGKAAMVGMLCAALLAAPLLGGCYGTFPMTRAIYKFNGDITGSRTVHALMFWLLLGVGVYDVALIGDALLVNVVEFWTGSDFGGGSAKATDGNGTTYAFAPSPDGREATLTASHGGKAEARVRFVRTSDTAFEVRDAAGKVTARLVRTPDGGLTLTNPDGLLVTSVPADQVAAALTR